jgi:putative phage-type endonuclease
MNREYNKAELELLKNPNIEIHHITTHTPEWHGFRFQGIGSSETALALNPPLHDYGSAMELFAEKTGAKNPRDFDNQNMFWGRAHEPTIAQIYQYYDGTPEGFIENRKQGKIIREVYETSYIVNKKYPWLFSSPDRLIAPPFLNQITGELLSKVGNCEIKTLSYHAAKKWENKIPIYYIVQVHQQMVVMEIDYTEIVILRDGNKFEVLPIERNERLAQRIIDQTHDFWYNRVLPGREYYIESRAQSNNKKRATDYLEKYLALEPDPDTTKAYEQFVNEKYLETGLVLEGNLKDFQYVKFYKWLTMAAKIIDGEKQRIKNYFIRKLQTNACSSININDRGYVRYSETDTGFRFTVNHKDNPTESIVRKQIQQLNKMY